MQISDRHLQILKHIHAFANIKSYHGLLPKKDALIYADEDIDFLKDGGFVEEGVIITTCGSNPKGYRLAEGARTELKKHGVDIKNNHWELIKDERNVARDLLDKEHVDALLDVYHFSKVKKYYGIAPKRVLEDYDKELLNYLYDSGYVFHIKLKGANVKYQSGYVLSDKARRVLKQLGYEV